MSEASRLADLAGAGWNVLRLPAASVPFDLFSDVPRDVLVPISERLAVEGDPDQICEALAPLTGDARLALATKGRAAELALVDGLELVGPPVVLTHGLFTTTQAALAHRGAVFEDLGLAGADGTADVDLDHLAERLGKGGVWLVYLELANSALFGWTLSEANIAGVRELCDRHGVTFVLDAARSIANSAALQNGDPVGTARRTLALAHAFTISCAKEMLVPTGSVVGSNDGALIARASQLLFKAGTSMSRFDPPQQQSELRDGARYGLGHPDLVRDRLALVRALSAALVEAGLDVVQPVTAHALYLPIDRSLVPAGDVAALISVLSHLYVVSGVRAQIVGTKRGPAIRLAVRLFTVLDERALRELVAGVAAFVGRIEERARLRTIDGQVDIAYLRRFQREEGA